MGEISIREMEDAMYKRQNEEEIHVRKIEDEIRMHFERSKDESEKKWRNELASLKQSHSLALENAEREYEKKLSELKTHYSEERKNICQEKGHERLQFAKEMRRQSTILRDFLKLNNTKLN